MLHLLQNLIVWRKPSQANYVCHVCGMHAWQTLITLCKITAEGKFRAVKFLTLALSNIFIGLLYLRRSIKTCAAFFKRTLGNLERTISKAWLQSYSAWIRNPNLYSWVFGVTRLLSAVFLKFWTVHLASCNWFSDFYLQIITWLYYTKFR